MAYVKEIQAYRDFYGVFLNRPENCPLPAFCLYSGSRGQCDKVLAAGKAHGVADYMDYLNAPQKIRRDFILNGANICDWGEPNYKVNTVFRFKES